jgi:hypothetical protein
MLLHISVAIFMRYYVHLRQKYHEKEKKRKIDPCGAKMIR